MNITAELQAQRDERYAVFQRRLLPTLPPESIVGVRTPALRAMAKRLAKEPDADTFLATLPHGTFEENQLHAFAIALERDFNRCLARVEAFLPYVDNWATCDGLRPRCFAKHTGDLLPHIKDWLHAEHEYTVRFGVGLLEAFYLDDAFEEGHLQWVAAIRREEYYIRMMQAWYFATALAKQWDAALPVIPSLPEWVRRKAIQKACESFRISDAHKTTLKKYR